MKKWTIKDAAETYNLDGWGNNYFKINDKGNVCVVSPFNNNQVPLIDIIDELGFKDINSPILLRFPDIMEDRIKLISDSFDKAAKEFDYKAETYTVYPIKVNQMKQVVEEVVHCSKKYNIGLEAGSKPELHAVLATAENDDAPIICNGYKDEEFIELALLAKKMGKDVYLVVEKLNELKLIIKLAKQRNVRPNIGIRIKLTSAGSGRWEDSGGDKSKFGLSPSELVDAVEIAKEADMLDCVKLIHFHLGSQITKIRRIKIALREAAQYYYQLRNLGCMVEYFDVGGGLGVDYDGTNSSNPSSINYDIQEYANDIVFAVVNISNKHNLPHPKIITESGRAITAHHSILIFDVLETMAPPQIDDSFVLEPNSHENIKELYNIFKTISQKNMFEHWHDANQIREENNTLFTLTNLDLKTRALTEKLFWSIAKKFRDLSIENKIQSEELDQASILLADKYFCNFSVFQSLPDSWAIDQIFPIMPIHRLNEYPENRATLQDITCDSDGKLDQFVANNYIEKWLPVHKLKKGEYYYLAAFMVGAYQEILGDLHNLFGDTNAAHVEILEDSYKITKIIEGEAADEVLSYVGFSAKSLVKQMETWVMKSVKQGVISAVEGKEYLATYRSGLYGYTYLE
jgi:arginine decarboxylase